MQEYDDALISRKFDNLQFVPFNRLLSLDAMSPTSCARLEAQFALHALMEIPDQYKFIKESGMLNSVLRARPPMLETTTASSALTHHAVVQPTAPPPPPVLNPPSYGKGG
eukprot:TRINITY_DN16515_c0_g1_i2.p2 TRINITY_DN16515_c0_g1~~TRINITY_DN16515_c0_g1_i2.p2  ORF type:complete len:110 (-),score=24.55 TRINITY_DN16515_c0_g1_i2:302-631(-)